MSDKKMIRREKEEKGTEVGIISARSNTYFLSSFLLKKKSNQFILECPRAYRYFYGRLICSVTGLPNQFAEYKITDL